VSKEEKSLGKPINTVKTSKYLNFSPPKEANYKKKN
jgi:hypothetical protein